MIMETERICQNCRKPLPPDVPLGLCPECLIKSGFPTETGPEAGGIGRFVPPPIDEIARLFPQFEILGFIGKGGMGAVYKARQPGLDRLVALKVLPPAVGSDPGFAERFNREARALARLSHPNIVVVYDFGKAGPLHYLVMEFVDGTNLREVERAGRLTPEQALAIVPQICEALQFAHNEGIVHRDVKPENLLLDKKGRVKITDFGIAKILGVSEGKAALTRAKEVMGTPHYMAPEQIEKPQAVDHRADIYSLGVVFYEMLTGELPLGKFAPPSKKVHVDVRLDEVVLHTLEKEPARRYQHVSEVKTDVQAITGTPPPMVRAMPAGAPPVVPASAPEAVSDKILLPTFLLAFFFGVFGAHRFYVGKIGTGVLQLFTLGGFGIWTTIDWILILCKVFTDGNGRRITNWWHPPVGAPKPAKPPVPSRPQAPPVIGGNLFGETLGGSPPMIIAPAVALIVAGFVKLFVGLMLIFDLPPHVRNGYFFLSQGFFSHMHGGAYVGFVQVLFVIVPAAMMIYGGAEMAQCGNYTWAVIASVAGIIFCSTLGLPAGIWALIVLLLPVVRARFASAPVPLARGRGLKISGGAAAAALLLCLIAGLFGSLHATHDAARTHKRPVTPSAATAAPAMPALPALPAPPSAAPPAATPPPAAPVTPATLVLPGLPTTPTNAAPLPVSAIDTQKQILQAQLNEAEMNLTNTEAQYSIGRTTSVDVDSAKESVDILQAVSTGDIPQAVQIAKDKLAQAQRARDAEWQLIQAGHASPEDLAPFDDAVNAAQLHVNMAEGADERAKFNVDMAAQRAKADSVSSNFFQKLTQAITNHLSLGGTTFSAAAFPSSPGGKLTMNVDRGDVQIATSDGNVATVRVTRKITGASRSEALQILKDEQVVLRQNGNEISITAQNPPELRQWSLFSHPNLEAHYEIRLPRQFDVRVETAGGEISVSDVQGNVHVQTAGGNMNISGIQGNVHAETAGGDINASGIQGSADVKTSGGRIICDEISGDTGAQTAGGDVRATGCKGRLNLDTTGGSITIAGFSGPGVHATTSGGSVSADFAAGPTEDSELKSSGGNLTVHLPDNAALQLEGRTSAGTATSDFPVKINDHFGNGTLSGVINGGGPVLRMETKAGNLDVMKTH
ncbi:MAG TPA: protein kinase [Verrucomicrobiae bacterium]|nr:protein kinase [Verrucomicrobiae bacterium]